MRNAIAVIILAVTAAVFCGCGKVEIICSIDNSNTAAMEITAEIPKDNLLQTEKEEIESFLSNAQIYWKNTLGYDVAYSDNNGNYIINLTKQKQCDTKEEAVYALLEMMGSDVSPFSSVAGGYNESYFNDYYNISAQVDLSGIIDYDFIDTLQDSDKEYITSKLSNFSGTASLNLDGDIVEYTGQLDNQTISADLSLDEVCEIYGLVELPNEENMEEYDALKDELSEFQETAEKYSMLLYIAIGVIILLASASVIILLIRLKKNKSKSEESADEKSSTESEK